MTPNDDKSNKDVKVTDNKVCAFFKSIGVKCGLIQQSKSEKFLQNIAAGAIKLKKEVVEKAATIQKKVEKGIFK